MIKFSVLASGSKENCTFIEINNTKILIDVGPSRRKMKELLASINEKLEDIDYILITHTHIDHIRGLKVLLKRYSPKVVIGKKMIDEIGYKYRNFRHVKKNMEINNINVTTIKTSHDCKESYGYILEYNNKSLVYITDTGYIKDKYIDELKGKTVYIFESNHDVEMLMETKRPYYLKQRILGDEGHLSNKDSVSYLSKYVTKNTKLIILAHLSEQANTSAKALQEFTKSKKFKKIPIDIAKQNTPTKIYKI